MKFFLISDSSDTLVGMRLAGIDGVRVQLQKEGEKALEEAVQDASIGIILVTPQVASLCKDKIATYQNRGTPLIVTIPDPSTETMENNMAKYISEAIGLQL